MHGFANHFAFDYFTHRLIDEERTADPARLRESQNSGPRANQKICRREQPSAG